MARPKSWLARVPLILKALDECPAPHFNRANIEQLFAIRASAAKELMSAWPTVGSPPAVRREHLLSYLREAIVVKEALAEIERRQRLAETLHKAAEKTRQRAVVLPCTPSDRWAQLRDLPRVEIARGRLTVAFADPLDLLAQLYRLVQAADTEPDAFARLCNTDNPDSLAGLSESKKG